MSTNFPWIFWILHSSEFNFQGVLQIAYFQNFCRSICFQNNISEFEYSMPIIQSNNCQKHWRNFVNDDRSAASSSKNVARLCVTLLLKSSNDIDVAVAFAVCSVPFALAMTLAMILGILYDSAILASSIIFTTFGFTQTCYFIWFCCASFHKNCVCLPQRGQSKEPL